jgi:NodT family efflux transporter outer membrane factor (OMF) lipoprotein
MFGWTADHGRRTRIGIAKPLAMGRAVFLAMLVALMSTGCPLKAPPTTEDVQKEAIVNVDSTRQWSAPAPTTGPVADDWIATFQDAQLDTLVGEAIAGNPDLRISAARVEQAAGYAKKAGAALLPAVDILARGSTKLGQDLGTGLSGGILSAVWELDLWGRIRYGKRAAGGAYASAVADNEYARQSIAAMTARTWFTATETLLESQLGNETVQSSQKLAELAGQRLDVGAGDERDVLLAEANANTYRDAVQQIGLAHEQSLRALEVILGRYPAAELQTRADLPKLPGPVPAGQPLEMLERRPDMIAAERRVAAAFDRVGEAKAAKLPQLSLTGTVGAITSEVLQLKDSFSNPVAGVGATLLAPLYRGGALQADVEIREGERKQAVAEYARSALNAISEVENALAASRTLAEREQILQTAVTQYGRALELEEIGYRVGKTDLRSVLDRQLVLYGARVALLRVQSEQLIQRVNLHLALGGSFQIPADSAQATAAVIAPAVPASTASPLASGDGRTAPVTK